jgi:hypothetical protein
VVEHLVCRWHSFEIAKSFHGERERERERDRERERGGGREGEAERELTGKRERR